MRKTHKDCIDPSQTTQVVDKHVDCSCFVDHKVWIWQKYHKTAVFAWFNAVSRQLQIGFQFNKIPQRCDQYLHLASKTMNLPKSKAIKAKAHIVHMHVKVTKQCLAWHHKITQRLIDESQATNQATNQAFEDLGVENMIKTINSSHDYFCYVGQSLELI